MAPRPKPKMVRKPNYIREDRLAAPHAERVRLYVGYSSIVYSPSPPFLNDLVQSSVVQERGLPSPVPHSHTPAQQERGDSKLKQGDNQLDQ